MNMQLLSAIVDPFYTEKLTPGSAEAIEKALGYGLPFSLFGFALVFGVLVVIMFVVIIFGKIFGAKQEKPKADKIETVKKSETVAAETPVAVASPVSDNGGIVAAIMAAISAFRSANGEKGGFRVVSFKKRK